MSWLPHVLGIDDESGPFYAWWSGAGSDISELVLLGGLYALLRKHNCHVHRCWRIGRLPVEIDGASYVVCRRHHPRGAPTHEDLRQVALREEGDGRGHRH